MAGPIKIAILANASQAKREFGEVQSRGQKFGKAINVGAKVAAGGLLLVGAAAIKAGKAAAEDEASQSKLAQALKTGAGATKAQIASTESWITAQGKALGVTDDELRPAIAQLATATGSVSKAQKLAKIGMDISAGSGTKLAGVTKALAKAQTTGSVTALAKYGVATKDADGKTRSLADVMKDLGSKYQGAAAKGAETTAGKQKILTVQLGELQEQIGAKLLPVMAKLATIGLQVVDYASKHGTEAKILVGVLVGLAGTVLVVAGAMKVYTAGVAIYNGVTRSIAVVTKIAAAGQWLLNAAMTANPIGIVIVAIVALVAIFVIAWKRSETFRKIVTGAWNAIRSASVAVWKAVTGAIVGAWRAITGAVSSGVSKAKSLVSGAWSAVRTKTVELWRGVTTAVGNAITALMGKVRAIKTKVVGVFSGAAGWLLGAGKKIISGLLDGIGAMIGKVKDKLSSVTKLIPDWKGPAAKDAKLLKPAGISIIQSLMDGFDVQTPAMRKQLQGLSKEISGFSASPTATVKLSAADAYRSQAAARDSLTLDVRFSAQQISDLEAGRSLQMKLNAYNGPAGRR